MVAEVQVFVREACIWSTNHTDVSWERSGFHVHFHCVRRRQEESDHVKTLDTIREEAEKKIRSTNDKFSATASQVNFRD